MNRCASLKSLLTIPGMTRDRAKLIRSIWLSKDEIPFDQENAPRTWKWAFQECHHEPKRREMKRTAIDEIAEMHGVELLGIHKGSRDYVYYCNAGDTYAATILFHGGNLSVGCWGDMVERNSVETNQEKIQRSFYS